MFFVQLWTPPNDFDYFLGNVSGKKNALVSLGFPFLKVKENGLSVHVVAQTHRH